MTKECSLVASTNLYLRNLFLNILIRACLVPTISETVGRVFLVECASLPQKRLAQPLLAIRLPHFGDHLLPVTMRTAR